MAYGSSYSLDEFQRKYGLTAADAERIYRVTGPSKADIDALMLARTKKSEAMSLVLEPSVVPTRKPNAE
jgi:hypothetical protein